MIDKVCKNPTLTGFSPLYNVNGEATLPAGTILTSIQSGEAIIFQTDSDMDILEDLNVSVAVGTAFEYCDSRCVTHWKCFLTSSCRFPTNEELEWYNKLASV